MKKATKGFIIGACVCMALGSVFCIGAAAAGGVRETRILAENDGLVIGPNGLFAGQTERRDIRNGDSENKGNSWGKEVMAAEYVIPLTDKGTIDLDLELGAGEFEIIESDTSDMIIRSNKKIWINEYENTIEIETPTTKNLLKLGRTDTHYQVTIEVPQGTVFDSVSVELGAGLLNIPIVRCRTLDVEVGAGKAEVGEFICTDASFSAEAGEILIENGSANEMDADVAMGHLEFVGYVEGYLDMECDMGDIFLQLYASEQDYNYQIDCGMGNVTVGESTYSGLGMEKNINNGAPRDFGIECNMGNVKVYFEKE